MLVNKITTGFVIQTFDSETNKFICQQFVAGDECKYENTDGEHVDFDSLGIPEIPYLPYDMVSPD
jgi:hypothetical protein